PRFRRVVRPALRSARQPRSHPRAGVEARRTGKATRWRNEIISWSLQRAPHAKVYSHACPIGAVRLRRSELIGAGGGLEQVAYIHEEIHPTIDPITCAEVDDGEGFIESPALMRPIIPV